MGFCVFLALLAAAFSRLPPLEMGAGGRTFLFAAGGLALWRYGWGLVNFSRSVVYRALVFPRLRARAEEGGAALMPSQAYILVTAYRIGARTLSLSLRSAVAEAAGSGMDVTIVASLVEMQDEFLVRQVFESCAPKEGVRMRIVRAAGRGKREGLALGFRAIARDLPKPDALVVVMDGDTALLPGVLRACAPFFSLMPRLGALTTDEHCVAEGSAALRDWHDMRFAQRHIYMSSVALSRRVMTLTGRMSVFRAGICTDPDFIRHMTEDFLDHGRLGRFRFLTGDDKSSLYWVMRRGYEQIYVPDAAVLTLEDAHEGSFFGISTRLMLRWFGNMLRTNMRVLRLGPLRMPFFVWWSFLDQRISMWTSLSGAAFALLLAAEHGGVVLGYYAVWALFVRGVISLALLSARPGIGWRYPFLLYYSHVYGALLKTWALFHLDRQSWTRQKTAPGRNLACGWALWNRWSSHAVHGASLVLLACAAGWACGVLGVPDGALRLAASWNHTAHGAL